jgi:hypothetical protein
MACAARRMEAVQVASNRGAAAGAACNDAGEGTALANAVSKHGGCKRGCGNWFRSGLSGVEGEMLRVKPGFARDVE